MENFKEMRVTGNVPDEQKAKVKKESQELFLDPHSTLTEKQANELKRVECPKTENEIVILKVINEKLKALAEEHGAAPYDIPAENIHIVPSDYFHQNFPGISEAVALPEKQMIFMDEHNVRSHLFAFADTVIHEQAHLLGDIAILISEDPDSGDFESSTQHAGWSMHASKKKELENKDHRHFEGTHEAIAAMIEKNMLQEMLELPLFEEEKKLRESDEWRSMRSAIAKKRRMDEDDIVWFNPKNEKEGDLIGYPAQREALAYVMSEIQKEFPDQYQTTDEVYKEFLRSQFTGRFLNVARLVEKTFGEGSFRILGNMDVERNSGIITLETLKKARMRMLRDA
ncbi:MAG: hypothetical protein M0P76_06925 [Candidatus Pacebacteria bacterium]|jgi:hypothetical protein|nr:hypothetical protein [Candidatus Paceibacterota bacterium]